MARDYYSVLVRAASALKPNTAEARRALYDRARHALADAHLSASEIRSERFALESAIQQVETDLAVKAPAILRPSVTKDQSLPSAPEDLPRSTPLSPASRRTLPIVISAAAVMLIVLIIGYQYWPRAVPLKRDILPETARVPPRGLDTTRSTGTPEESSLSYVFKRQLVYYRTIHPVGTVIIAKSQHFLYLIRSNTSALRYTIGVGRQCASLAGLLRISAKEDWTNAKPGRLANEVPPTDDQKITGGDGQFGARSLALGETGYRVHGTGEPVLSRVIGCFPLVNDDVIDLYDRIPIGTRVVMN